MHLNISFLGEAKKGLVFTAACLASTLVWANEAGTASLDFASAAVEGRNDRSEDRLIVTQDMSIDGVSTLPPEKVQFVEGVDDVIWGLSEEAPVLVGFAVMAFEDIDRMVLIFNDERNFEALADLVGEETVNREDWTVKVEPAGLVTVTERHAETIDFLVSSANRRIMEHHGKERAYYCLGTRTSERVERIAQCAFFDGDNNIYAPLLSVGMAAYWGNVPSNWLHNQYQQAQSAATRRSIGVWQPDYAGELKR